MRTRMNRGVAFDWVNEAALTMLLNGVFES
jgi:hypothetical protein